MKIMNECFLLEILSPIWVTISDSLLQARVVLYKDVAALLQITFNAINSDNSNWL